MNHIYLASLGLLLLLISSPEVKAQDAQSRARLEGTAIVTVGESEYTIPIECEDSGRPELGFSTEPSRITRERTGRTSGINLRVRSVGESEEVVISLDRYVAWMARPESTAGILSLELDMSPASLVRDNMPVALTRDMWMSGDRPEGIEGVKFEAQCTARDQAAPSFRRISGG